MIDIAFEVNPVKFVSSNKRLHYMSFNSSVNSPPTSPFYTVLYANQVPLCFEC